MPTATRVLRLLSLLQARREWSGSELGERLEVDVRTIRRDANRLRDLGYVIEATSGPGGGYRLSAGASTPPLLLEDDEALTIALALAAMAGNLADFTDTALRVLVKLDQLLPSRLRRKWVTQKRVTLTLPGSTGAVDAAVLTRLAAACRDQQSVTFKYGDRAGKTSSRDVEPMRLVHTGRVWYLVAWDKHRADWRTFRVDRVDGKAGLQLGSAFVPREPPEDFATIVARAVSASPYRLRAKFKLHLTLEAAQRQVPGWVGVLEALDEQHCTLTVGADSHEALMAHIALAGVEFELMEPRELAKPLRAVCSRLLRGVNA